MGEELGRNRVGLGGDDARVVVAVEHGLLPAQPRDEQGSGEWGGEWLGGEWGQSHSSSVEAAQSRRSTSSDSKASVSVVAFTSSTRCAVSTSAALAAVVSTAGITT